MECSLNAPCWSVRVDQLVVSGPVDGRKDAAAYVSTTTKLKEFGIDSAVELARSLAWLKQNKRRVVDHGGDSGEHVVWFAILLVACLCLFLLQKTTTTMITRQY